MLKLRMPINKVQKNETESRLVFESPRELI